MKLKSIGIEGFERILDRMNALFYISDPLTDELLYISPGMCRHFGLRDGEPPRYCWQLLRGGTGRCAFCPIPTLLLNPSQPHVWEETNEVTGGTYKNTDTLIEWEDGRLVHLHYREDVTNVRAAEAAFRRRLAQQELMSSLSQSFIQAASMSTLIPGALRMVGEFMQVGKVVLMRYDREHGTLEAASYIWYNDGKDTYHPENISMPLEKDSITYRSFIDGDQPYIACNDVVNSVDCGYAASHGVKSLLDIPIHVDGEYWGSLSVNECENVREWSESDIQLARMIGNIISGAISRNRMEEKLIWAMEHAKESSKAKGEFLSRMSHEIRTPLGAVIGMTNIARTTKDPKKKEHCLEKIEEASVHLLGVINDILDMSKIEAQKFELAPTDFDFEAMLARVVNVVTFRANEKNQTLVVNMDEDLRHRVVADEQRLAQVIVNLLSNAVKFTPEKGTITLTAEKQGESDGICDIKVSVADTGIGMTEEQRSRLFKSFEQADRNTARNYGGTGLGLAISKSIVEMMGGRIWAESEPGKGSTFTFTIRMRRGSGDTPEPAGPDVQPTSEGGYTGRHILLAEDIEVNREIVLAMLEDTGVGIDCAENGRVACEMFASNPGRYDLILMDIHMPEMDGYEATRRIRGMDTEEARKVPIVAMTANVFREDIERCLAAGMNEHISKPIDPGELYVKLQSILA